MNEEHRAFAGRPLYGDLCVWGRSQVRTQGVMHRWRSSRCREEHAQGMEQAASIKPPAARICSQHKSCLPARTG